MNTPTDAKTEITGTQRAKPKKPRFVGFTFPKEDESQRTIFVKWSPSSEADIKYKLIYFPVIEPENPTTLILDTTEYTATDLSLDRGGLYRFKVIASTPEEASDPTELVTSTVRLQRPGQLEGLTTRVRGQTSLTIEWDVSSNAGSYEVSHDKMDTPIVQVQNRATFVDLDPGTYYTFWVTPLSTSGIAGGGASWRDTTAP